MSQTPIIRILDAALNRASEGLRVAEDYVRFVLDDPFLTRRMKALRHDLTAAASSISSLDRHQARDTRQDVGTSISTDSEVSRKDNWDVCAASLKRAEQSIRSLEEYGKLLGGEFAGSMESLRYVLYTLEKAIDVGRSSRVRLDGVRLCVLVSGGDSVAQFEQLIVELVAAGVGMIQLRDKQLDDRDLIHRARLLVSITRSQPPALPGVSSRRGVSLKKPPAEPGAAGVPRTHTLGIVNDRADIAAAVGADGVHVGQEDLSVKDVRAIIGTRMLIGVSTHNIEQARAAVLDGADYLGAGPTFASRTKHFDGLAGLDYLRQVSRETRLPTFAIGGIVSENLLEVLATGTTRVAVGAAVTSADNVRSAVQGLSDVLDAPATAARSSHLLSTPNL